MGLRAAEKAKRDALVDLVTAQRPFSGPCGSDVPAGAERDVSVRPLSVNMSVPGFFLQSHAFLYKRSLKAS
jgi:hypothetical protein